MLVNCWVVTGCRFDHAWEIQRVYELKDFSSAEEKLRAEGYPVREEDAARLSPFVRKHLGVHGTYSFLLPELEPGAIRELLVACPPPARRRLGRCRASTGVWLEQSS